MARVFVQKLSIGLNCKLLRKRDPPQGLLKALSRPETEYEDGEYISTSSRCAEIKPQCHNNFFKSKLQTALRGQQNKLSAVQLKKGRCIKDKATSQEDSELI